MTRQRRSQGMNCKCRLVGEFLFPVGEGLSEYIVHVFETSVDHASSESWILWEDHEWLALLQSCHLPQTWHAHLFIESLQWVCGIALWFHVHPPPCPPINNNIEQHLRFISRLEILLCKLPIQVICAFFVCVNLCVSMCVWMCVWACEHLGVCVYVSDDQIQVIAHSRQSNDYISGAFFSLIFVCLFVCFSFFSFWFFKAQFVYVILDVLEIFL